MDTTSVVDLFNIHERRRRGHGRRRGRNKNMNLHDHVDYAFLENVWDGPNRVHNTKTILYSLPLKHLHKLWEVIQDTDDTSHTDEDKTYLHNIIQSTVHIRLFKPATEQPMSETKRKFLKVEFHNKGIQYINIAQILRNKKVQATIPPYFDDREPPTICYKYNSSIATKIFNYNQVVNNFDSSTFDIGHPDCDCNNSSFTYAPSGHVFTGDLNIIPDEKLKQLIRRGPKYREQKPINWSVCKKILMDAIEEYGKKWCKREGCHCEVLEEWISTVKEIVHKKIKNLRKKSVPYRPAILQDPNVKACLTQLQNKFVLVPADKASNNVIFICRWYYLRVVCNELGLCGLRAGSSTYEIVNDTSENTISKITSDLIIKFKLPIGPAILPSVYWTPKLHKNPYGQRFIVGAKKSVLKPLCQMLTRVLQLVQDNLERYCNTIYLNSGVKMFWILKNSTELLKWLKNPDNPVHLKEVETWDFSTLYTTFPHDILIESLVDLVKFVFKKNSSHVQIYSRYAQFKTSGGSNRYTCDQICGAIKLLFNSNYIRCGDVLLKQVIGFPMGIDCGPLCANLCLFKFESDKMKDLMKQRLVHIARKFCGTWRYIDDVNNINNPQFKEVLSTLYPPELVLNKTSSPDSASYLDLYFQKVDGEYKISLYDKRDDYNFEIVNFPWMDSNIPEAPTYGIYISRLIAFARACDDYQDFSYRHKNLVTKLQSQGFTTSGLKAKFIVFFNKYNVLVNKYQLTPSAHLLDVYGSD